MKGGRPKIVYYSEEEVIQKKRYYNNLPEKMRRHFLGQEYLHLSKGSQRYLSSIFECSRHTIRKGVEEIQKGNSSISYTRQRKVGGGRKKKK
jgi:hypothetical protein